MKNYVERFPGFAKAFNFVMESISKKKADQDGDGDTDFVDAKIAQYKAGGIPKDKAIAKGKMFAKRNNIKDDGAAPVKKAAKPSKK